MRKELIIVSSCEETSEGFDNESLSVNTFETAHDAKTLILNTLKEESSELNDKLIKDSGDITDLFSSRKEGYFSYRIGDHYYHFKWMKASADYNVTEDEMYETLEAYCNSSRDHSEYMRLAERISVNMHRYVQNQLWKLIKHIIRTFAMGRYDERNKVAHDQAEAIVTFMNKDNNF